METITRNLIVHLNLSWKHEIYDCAMGSHETNSIFDLFALHDHVKAVSSS